MARTRKAPTRPRPGGVKKEAAYWEWGARGQAPAYGEFYLVAAGMTVARSTPGEVMLRYDSTTGELIGVVVPLNVMDRSIPEWLAEE
jgi:hypothetical protein